jgi:aspartate/glutamate racemase
VLFFNYVPHCSLVLKEGDLTVPVIDPISILAEGAVENGFRGKK